LTRFFYQAIITSTWHQQFEKAKVDYKTLQGNLTPEELNDLGNIESLSSQFNNKEKEFISNKL